ncbi:response regulator transcription factor [Desertivirga brevis]|uniref:response regulator transcription factor n=1 Tax=Desertivirga brevis TaxID=2810310 RepID=UPI001A958AED|nr:response regulator [Pedobacter sp. SYSU D00873]
MADTILVVDDNEDILDFLTEILSDVYEVKTASDGSEALAILDDQMVSLIVSDIMMPGIDGFELCQSIKSNVAYCHIPLILLTAKNTYKARVEGLEVGADAYIEKPFSPEYLIAQINNLLKNRAKIKDHFAHSPFEDVRVMAYSKTDELFLKRLNDHIHKNIRNANLDIDMLSDHMNMSRPTFYRKIKSLSSLSPKELINLTRLRKAAELLATRDYKIYEIAEMVGFASQSVFGKNFQKQFKMTPLEYVASLKPKQN